MYTLKLQCIYYYYLLRCRKRYDPRRAIVLPCSCLGRRRPIPWLLPSLVPTARVSWVTGGNESLHPIPSSGFTQLLAIFPHIPTKLPQYDPSFSWLLPNVTRLLPKQHEVLAFFQSVFPYFPKLFSHFAELFPHFAILFAHFPLILSHLS